MQVCMLALTSAYNQYIHTHTHTYILAHTYTYRFAIATVISWLPADKSEFVSTHTGQPAALWRLHFDEGFELDKTSE